MNIYFNSKLIYYNIADNSAAKGDDEEDEGSYDVQTTHEIPSNMKIEQYSLKWLLNEESPIHTILLDEINL